MKPSEFIKNANHAVAWQRLAKQKEASGRMIILQQEVEKRVLATIENDPMTWIVSILAYLDHQQEQQEAWKAKLDKIENDLDNYLASVGQ